MTKKAARRRLEELLARHGKVYESMALSGEERKQWHKLWVAMTPHMWRWYDEKRREFYYTKVGQ